MSPLSRRRFHALLAGLSVATVRSSEAQPVTSPEVLQFGRNGWMPNNAALPTLWYHGAIATGNASEKDPAERFEAVFTGNGWPPQWRNGVYTFHHYHSTTHEVLGFAAGSARLVLGGEGGREVTVHAGDVLLLPTGTGHCELSKSDDFLVVGAYPPGCHWDICRKAPDAETEARMRAMPLPHADPVYGANGPLAQHWR